jgi:predicted amidohydrolase
MFVASQVLAAAALGVASGLLAVITYRLRWAWLGWIALAPLAAATFLYSPVAAAAGGWVCGLLVGAGDRQLSVPAEVIPRARAIEAGLSAMFALPWAVAFGLAAWAWPNNTPAWGAVLVPAATLTIALFLKTRAPYYWSWFLGSQDSALPVVHISRIGTDLVIPVLLGLAASVPAMLFVQSPSAATVVVAGASSVVVAAAVVYGFRSYRRSVEALGGGTVRVAAVADAPRSFDDKDPEYLDVDAAIRRYQPHIDQAITAGAEVIVLPEYAVSVNSQNRQTWLEAVAQWAVKAHGRVVAGFGDRELHKDQLVIANSDGQLVAYDKQHPAPGLEPKPERRTPPAVQPDPFPVSAVVCVDNDYADLVRPVARSGGVLAVPANDWAVIVDMHHRSAVWSAVRAGVPLVRSSGHGISSVRDAAGRVVSQANSCEGPVVLVADIQAPARAGA